MKIKRIEYLLRTGPFFSSNEFRQISEDVQQAIEAVKWPPGSPGFWLYPGSRRDHTHNGVKPIKLDCMQYLLKRGWHLEDHEPFSSLRVGEIDAAKQLPDQRFAVVEWETGNISSSHRALNKIALGIIRNTVAVGFLILPSRVLYQYLTDRIGNYQELEPYFELYRRIAVNDGVLSVIEIEHDKLDQSVPRIPLGTDGRASR